MVTSMSVTISLSTFLKGNHEYEIIDHFLNPPNKNWLSQVRAKTLLQHNQINRKIESDIKWFMKFPLFWENENIFISHAGISNDSLIPFNKSDPNGTACFFSLYKT
ncbi:hypothetical protein BWGOE8_25820 [Bacillus mycoides]|uniref:Serine/threonine protein phosphatase n=2 Tax=Bacillus mycoides TaxID=1405 RepID=A0A1E8B7B7_BACMY|nr:MULTISPECIES: hypothetical protein [Bacillus cereus group]OFD78945.1 hypothetical protein BWGOE9_26060 [Bacillus mycoides]OFD79093.1 hypothetical protein BWGOE8_25820 [Bacillus mycoides]OFD80833.1 hypothetical protein BWGOE10_26480 [Bacillus mycoides]